MIIGLTGGICCGKSTVAKTFTNHGIPEVDADLVARQVVGIGTPGLYALRYAFGDEYLQPDGSLDRIRLGSLVFSDPSKMDLLNAIMGPLIVEEADKQLRSLSAIHPITVYNAALICEMGHANLYRPLIVVQCQGLTQINRLMKRNGLTADEAMRRISAQMPMAQKVALANYVINTDKSIDESISQTVCIIEKLKNLV